MCVYMCVCVAGGVEGRGKLTLREKNQPRLSKTEFEDPNPESGTPNKSHCPYHPEGWNDVSEKKKRKKRILLTYLDNRSSNQITRISPLVPNTLPRATPTNKTFPQYPPSHPLLHLSFQHNTFVTYHRRRTR